MPSLSGQIIRNEHSVEDKVFELTLDLGFDIVDGVRRFDLEGDGLTRKGLNEDLHDGLEVEYQLPHRLHWAAF